mgnify:CR=1 FL=1
MLNSYPVDKFFSFAMKFYSIILKLTGQFHSILQEAQMICTNLIRIMLIDSTPSNDLLRGCSFRILWKYGSLKDTIFHGGLALQVFEDLY